MKSLKKTRHPRLAVVAALAAAGMAAPLPGKAAVSGVPSQQQPTRIMEKSAKGDPGNPVENLLDAVLSGRPGGAAPFIQSVRLSAGQQAQLQRLIQSTHQQVQPLLSASGPANEGKIQKVGRLLRAFQVQVETLLTLDQWRQLPNPGAEEVGQFGWETRQVMSLGLTDDQAVWLKGLHESWERKVQAATGDESLSEAEKESKVKEADHWADRQLLGVLTADLSRRLDDLEKAYPTRN